MRKARIYGLSTHLSALESTAGNFCAGAAGGRNYGILRENQADLKWIGQFIGQFEIGDLPVNKGNMAGIGQSIGQFGTG